MYGNYDNGSSNLMYLLKVTLSGLDVHPDLGDGGLVMEEVGVGQYEVLNSSLIIGLLNTVSLSGSTSPSPNIVSALPNINFVSDVSIYL